MVAQEANLSVVAGVGAVGRAVIDALIDLGMPVRALARGPVTDLPAEVEVVAVDLTDPRAARQALAGAAVVYHTASGPYDRWPELLPPLMRGIIAGASASGPRIVYADNLYAYGPVDGPLSEDLPYLATGPNGRVRASLADLLMDAHGAGTVRATIGRASDYYGPRGVQSTVGERLFVPALTGKRALVLGDPDQPHTVTFLPDYARGLVTLGTHDEAFGQVWHVPNAETLTTREFAQLVFQAASHPLRLQVLPSGSAYRARALQPDDAGAAGAAIPAHSALDRRPLQVCARVRRPPDAPRRGDFDDDRLVREGRLERPDDHRHGLVRRKHGCVDLQVVVVGPAVNDAELCLGLSECSISSLQLAPLHDIEWAAHADEQDIERCPHPGEIVHPSLLEKDVVDDDVEPRVRDGRRGTMHGVDELMAKLRASRS